MGASLPPADWWRPFIGEDPPPRRQTAYHPGVVAPKIRIRFDDLMQKAEVIRAQRQVFGYHRLCYERHLRYDPTFEGFWVVRIAQSSSNEICALDVIASNLPAEMSDCLEERLGSLEDYGSASGTFEVAFTYWPKPWRR